MTSTAAALPIRPTGIASLGLHFPPGGGGGGGPRPPPPAPKKYTHGLGCDEMSICPPDYGVVELATEAARRALERWQGDPSRIGMLAVGTETAVDMSRPLSAWIAERLGLRGAIRSYEVKHACYGGTLAVRQAAEWRMSGAAQDKAALVVAADVALYAQGDPGEPTQGAGAVAMVIDEPEVAALDPVSHAWSEPEFDFWRPVGEAYPRVDGALSLDCYKRAAEHCFKALVGKKDPDRVLGELAAICFHVPFPKMVKKAVYRVGELFGWDGHRIEDFFRDKVNPTMLWNRLSGNAYTASLWISVANALKGLAAGQRLAAFSYGSGFGAELLVLEAGPAAAGGAWAEDVERDLASRTRLDADAYTALRGR